MSTTDNHDRNQSNKLPQGDIMTTNDTNTCRWTKPDGTTIDGTFDELGAAYAASGFAGTLQALDLAPEDVSDEDTSDEPTEDAVPVSVVAVTPTRPVVAEVIARREAAADRTDWTTQVHEDDRKAAEADAAMLKAAGLTPGRTYFAPGTPLVRWGLDKWRTERTNLDAAPRVGESAAAIRDAVQAEQRQDSNVRPSELRMIVSGGRLVLTRGNGALQVERHGLDRLVSAFPGMLPEARFRRTMEADETAYLWNQRAPRLLADRKPMVLRHRLAPDGSGRSLYAAVSTSYGAHDADAIAADLAHILPTDMRGPVVYDADRVGLTWELSSMRDVPPVVGEVWKAGLGGSSKDDGTGSARSWGAFWRAICCNLTTEVLDTARTNQRHRGHHVAESFRRQVLAAWKAMGPAFDAFRSRWEVLDGVAATDLLGGADVREAIARMVDQEKGLRDAAGVKRDVLVGMLLQAHSAEPGETLTSVVNAVTRLHESKLAVSARTAVEAQAGLLAVDWTGRVVAARS